MSWVQILPPLPYIYFRVLATQQGCERLAAQETAIQGNTARWKKFLREVKAELKKVIWPSKNELISYTGVVFVSVTAVAILIWIIDTALNQILTMILK